MNYGADYALIENETLESQLKAFYPQGVTKILELIGPVTLTESMNLLRKHGIVCVTGILGKKATVDHFYPIKDIPSGVYLTGFVSNKPDQAAIDSIFSLIRKHQLKPRIAAIFPLKEMAKAHRLMEDNLANGKVVIRL